VEEIGVARESNRPAASHWQTLSHYTVSSTPRNERDFQRTNVSININPKIALYLIIAKDYNILLIRIKTTEWNYWWRFKKKHVMWKIMHPNKDYQ